MLSDLGQCRALADFEGRWAIARDITATQGPSGRFEGQGAWRVCADGLDYIETGTLTMAGAAPMVAQRRYLWTPDLSVFLDDGRFFHKVPEQGGRATHWCDPDTYTVDYDFGAWPVFEVHWHVRGPRKAYEMTSRYTRLDVG